jgi:oxygen-independent coproporphyrinogen-3 oxidase
MRLANDQLLSKYNIPVPRYTSYPTVPYWQETDNPLSWLQAFASDFSNVPAQQGFSLYIHLPFCESLCTYCGCNKKITNNHSVEEEYIAAIHKEWQQYLDLMPHTPLLRELHLGGGTPTFFSPQNLKRLLEPILATCHLHPQHEFSFEGHPNNTTAQHLQTLFDLGFRRVSYGVQDNDPEVQRIINRLQPFENVVSVTDTARQIGYESVNFDLIYGLPKQTQESMVRTIAQTISLKPDRVAFYSYAHVPWTSRGQRLFDENDLPSTAQKLALYQTGREMFLEAGYVDVGMDHFALPTDELCVALQQGRLHRSFMGYTTQRTDILIGLGVSAISTTPSAYVQNEKTLHNYYNLTNEGNSPVKKICMRSDEDRRFGKYILDVSCTGTTTFHPLDADAIATYAIPLLQSLEKDGLVVVAEHGVTLTVTGKNYVRNVCSAFDLHLQKNRPDTVKKVFSQSV